MSQTTTLSTVIGADIKRALTQFCKKRGLKVQYVVERAIIDQLEDEIDLETYHQRKSEETIAFSQVLKQRK